MCQPILTISDVERYMSTRPAIVKPDEPFDIYEIDLSDEDAAAE